MNLKGNPHLISLLTALHNVEHVTALVQVQKHRDYFGRGDDFGRGILWTTQAMIGLSAYAEIADKLDAIQKHITFLTRNDNITSGIITPVRVVFNVDIVIEPVIL